MNQRRCCAKDNGAVGAEGLRGIDTVLAGALSALRRRFSTSPRRVRASSGFVCTGVLLSIITPTSFSNPGRSGHRFVQSLYLVIGQAVDLFGYSVFDQDSKFSNGGCLENRFHWQFDLQRFAQARKNARDHERMSAQIEEIVVHANLRKT